VVVYILSIKSSVSAQKGPELVSSLEDKKSHLSNNNEDKRLSSCGESENLLSLNAFRILGILSQPNAFTTLLCASGRLQGAPAGRSVACENRNSTLKFNRI
jgi:hypothetical protein